MNLDSLRTAADLSATKPHGTWLKYMAGVPATTVSGVWVPPTAARVLSLPPRQRRPHLFSENRAVLPQHQRPAIDVLYPCRGGFKYTPRGQGTVA
jgi:hypothetical protein